jgi:transcription factor SPT20
LGSRIITTMDTPSGAPKDVRRFVTTQQDILAKFKGCPPSLRVSLYPNHFRLNDVTDTHAYTSPLRSLLVHIRAKTIPHDNLEELHQLNIPFYDNCLIVEMRDYRMVGLKAKEDINSAADGNGMKPFSIHNYHEYITPSPHVPYPADKPVKKANVAEPVPKQEKAVGKENMPAPGQLPAQKQSGKPRVETCVLFPTPQSHHADMVLLANTPVPDPVRRNHVTGRAGGNPATPLTAVPPTSTLATGRSPKRQKMMVDENNLYEVEAAIYDAQCPKLYLEPTKNFAESLALMEAITHPNNKNPPPERKTRKRTTAELAADEAEAADMQRYMLAGDEGQAGKTAAATGGDDGQHAVRADANQQTFSRFKALSTIKTNHEDAERRKKEEEARALHAKRQAQAEADVQKQRRETENRAAEQNAAMQQQQQQQQQRQELMLRQQQQNQQQALHQASQAQQMANAAAHAHAQTPHSATQAQFASPVVRQMTPMIAAPSPLMAGHASHPMGSTPMAATSSNHGAGSPPARPPSSISQHPMARSASQQQNPMSRTGTPHISQGTPVMNTAMPARNVSSTPTPRMNQGSPNAAMQGSTPIMMQTPQGNAMTPEQMQMAQQHSQMAQVRMRQQMAQGMSPGTNGAMQQIALQRATMYIQTHGIPNNQNPQAYRALLAQQMLRNMQLQQQQQQSQQQSQPHQQNPQGQLTNISPGIVQPGMPNGTNVTVANMSLQQLKQYYNQRKQQLLAQFGPSVPQAHVQNIRQLELVISQRESAVQNNQQQQQQQQQMAQGGQVNMNQGGMPQMGMQAGSMQQYQSMLAQQRLQQAHRQQQINALRQQQMAANGGSGQLNSTMMNNMQGMNMNMGNMQGVNMGNLQGNMQGMQGMNMAGMQGGMNVGNMQGVNPQQHQQQQQMMMMRRAQMGQQMGQQQQQQQNQSGGM